MFVRVAVVATIVNPPLLAPLAVPIGAFTVAGLVASALLYRRSQVQEGAHDVKLRNPFELGSALKFGAIYAAVLWVAKGATDYAGSQGVYAASVLAGATDANAITVSMANLSKGGALGAETAATAILLASVANTLVKGGMAFVLGAAAFRKRVGIAFAAMIAAGLAGLIFVWV
jgi:uncharacterized membrane protein (DUF4010 family)